MHSHVLLTSEFPHGLRCFHSRRVLLRRWQREAVAEAKRNFYFIVIFISSCVKTLNPRFAFPWNAHTSDVKFSELEPFFHPSVAVRKAAVKEEAKSK